MPFEDACAIGNDWLGQRILLTFLKAHFPMQAKHRERFFQLADVFLSSSLVPAYTIAAFAKRFACLALTASPAGEVLRGSVYKCAASLLGDPMVMKRAISREVYIPHLLRALSAGAHWGSHHSKLTACVRVLQVR